MVRDTFTLTVPPGAPAGLYDVQVGWYPTIPRDAGDGTAQDRLRVGEASSFRVAVLPVSWQTTGMEAVTRVDAGFGEAIKLEGYAVHTDAETVYATLRWSTSSYLDNDYTVFVHLVGADGDQALAQGDAPPLAGRWPTSLWLPGVPLDDGHIVPLPPDLQPGVYHLLTGLYDPATGERLPLPDGSNALHLVEIHLP